MRVLKFGGSSVGSPERIEKVKQIIAKKGDAVLVVVSALQGITDQLEAVSRMAAAKDQGYKNLLTEIRTRHTDTVTTLITSDTSTILSTVESQLDELTDILEGVYLLNDLTPKVHDRIVSFGELLSSQIIAEYLKQAQFLDSREVIKTNSKYGNAKVDFDLTNKLIQSKIDANKGVYIVPGFVASNAEGITTTLGRGGSDYTAAIYASALDCEALEIWTDVDGFMTADPRKVSKAFAIESLSYAEAMELSHFGAKVVYTPTIQPAFQKEIPIHVKNTFNPDAQGTVISNNLQDQAGPSPIKGVSSIDDIDLITLQGPGMVGVKGISSRLFGALASKNVNIIMITQASSEYSITFAVSPMDTEKAVKAIEKEFEPEIHIRHEVNILVEKDLSIIAIVGEQMKNKPGISGTLFRALGRNGISVIATAQGSSELNISVVIRKDSLRKALNVIHEGFFLSHIKELHLYVVGVGTVGSALMEQIKQQQEKLLEDHNLRVNVVGICRTKKMLLTNKGAELDDYMNLIEREGETTDLRKFIDYIKKQNLRNSVFVDCTADDELAQWYPELLDSYVSVVTANKVACSSDYKFYQGLKKSALEKNVKFMFETNVGAGLPIITTINDLMRSGDKIKRMEAVLSGTLNFLFNELSEDLPLSQAIMLAKEKGFSEPDPRIDLSGIDVVRKLLILARESGYPLEQKDIQIEPFLPADCFEGSLDDFWQKVAEHDAEFEERRKQLVAEGKKWRFVAVLDEGKGSVSLQAVDSMHPAYPLEGSNNILMITTERYNEAPMVIRGYGAGAEVTAAGVFADIIRVANI